MALVKKQNANWWYYESDGSDSNINKGIITGLDSDATTNSQPSGNMNAWNNKINGANPSSPSTNNATRREQYNVDKNNYSLAEQEWNMSHPGLPYPKGDTMISEGYTDKIWPNYSTSKPTEQTGKRELKSYYSDLWGKEALERINATFNEKGINTAGQYFEEIYWEAQATALSNAMQANVDLWKALTEYRWFLWHTSTNADFVRTLANTIYEAVAYNMEHGITNDINEIAKNTWATPEEVQAVLTGDAYRLIELTDEYKNREFRQYYRKWEDLTLEMQYNRDTFMNSKNNLDYQFNSTMDKLEKSLFDAQQYQSAQAQLNINYALENYTNAMVRLDQDLDYITQDAQKLALQTITNLNSAVAMTATEQKQVLLKLQSDIDAIKSQWLQSALTQLEKGNTALSKQIAEAYGLSDLTSVTTTWGGTYTPSSQESVDWALYTITSSTSYANGKKIRSWECWTIVNDYLWMIGAWFKISYASDMEKYINYRGTDPAVWSIVYFAPGSLSWMSEGWKKFWHVAIVTGVNKEKWTITVRESNASTGIRTHEYNMSDVYGYFEPAQWYSSTEDWTDYSEYDAEVNDKYNILSTLKTELEAVDFDQNRKKLAKQNWEWNNIKSLDAFETLWNWGIRTMWALFSQAVDADAKYHSEALQIISGAPKTMWALDTVVTDFARIYNKNFIDYLIQSKGQGATFWNLTEWEWFKILTAANEMSAWMSQDDLLNRINNAIQLIEKRKKKNQSTVTPQLPQNSREANDVLWRISSTMWSWFWTWTNGYSTGPTVNTTFTNTTFTK